MRDRDRVGGAPNCQSLSLPSFLPPALPLSPSPLPTDLTYGNDFGVGASSRQSVSQSDRSERWGEKTRISKSCRRAFWFWTTPSSRRVPCRVMQPNDRPSLKQRSIKWDGHR